MSTIIKELIAKFSGDTSGLESSTAKASSVVASFGKAAVAAAAAAAVAFSALAIHEAKVGDELGKASDRAGAATDSFIQLGHATELAGLSTEGLSNVLKFMQKNVYDAAAGNKELEASLKRLGTSSKELLALTPEAAFKKIVSSLGSLGNAAERTKIAMELLGRSGTDVLTLAQKGADYFKKMADESDRFGLTISRVDSEALNNANDSVEKIGDAAAGAARQFAVGIAPAISSVNERMLASLDIAKLFRTAGDAVGDAWVTAIQRISIALDQWEQLSIKVAATAKNLLFTGTKEEGEAIQKMADARIQAIQNRMDLQKAGKASSYQSDYDDEKARLKKENDILKNQKPASMGGGVDVPLSKAALDEAKKASEEYARSIKKSMDATKEYNNSIADQFISIKDGFMQGASAADVFKKTALNALNEIGNSIIKNSFGGNGGGGIFGSIASSLMGSFGGGALGGGSTISKNLGRIDWLPSFAVGTNYVPKDMVAQIHEGEQIIPKGKNVNGPTVVQNLTINAGVSQTIRAEVLRMLPQIKQETVRAVAESTNRGTSI